MKVFQTNPVLAFSAINMVIPVSIPMTSVVVPILQGLKALTNPYLPQAAAIAIPDSAQHPHRQAAAGKAGTGRGTGHDRAIDRPGCGGPPQIT